MDWPIRVESPKMTRPFRHFLVLLITAAAFAIVPTAGAAISFGQIGNGGFTNDANVVVTYSDPNGILPASTNCILDSSSSVTCSTSSADLGALAEGTHTLLVNAMYMAMMPPCMIWADPPANTICASMTPTPLPTSGSVTFTVDRTAPALQITSGPAEGSSSTQTTASFGIDAGDGTATCTLDGTVVTCGTAAELTGLTVGEHELVVTSTDQAGNAATATRRFTVSAPPATPGPPGTCARKYEPLRKKTLKRSYRKTHVMKLVYSGTPSADGQSITLTLKASSSVKALTLKADGKKLKLKSGRVTLPSATKPQKLKVTYKFANKRYRLTIKLRQGRC